MHEHELSDLRRRADALRAEGYDLDIRLEGYTVRRNERFVGGASIMGVYKGRSAKMKVAARAEHLKSAVILGEGHQERLDHLQSFAADGFVPSEGQMVLDIESGLIGKVGELDDDRVVILAGDHKDAIIYERSVSDVAPLSPKMKVFAAEVEFSRRGETYGTETFNIVARWDTEATKIASEIAEDSVHDDCRIIGRRRRVSASPNPDFVAHVAEMEEARTAGPRTR